MSALLAAHPLLLLAFLLALVLVVLSLEKQAALARVFHYLPSAFWCYFLPMALSTVGLLPEESPTYNFLTTYVLCACLVLLLLNINLPAIFRLGPTALGAMGVGAFGIAAGAVVAYAIFGRWLSDETWKGVGALSASWIGGSANMLAVKEGLHTPDSVFAPMVIVDTIITYSWMGILVALAPWQDWWDQKVKADRSTLDEVNRRLEAFYGGTAAHRGKNASGWHGLWLMFLGGSVGALCLRAGERLPQTTSLSASGWAFLLVTVAGIGLSLTPAAKLEMYGASRWGYFCLYLLLAAIGSKARLQYILKAPLLILMAYVWVLIHAGILAAYGSWRRIPMFFLVTSSQANIGGTASTPIVAGVYQPRLAPLGLLLAIAGNVIGTYAGIAIAQACHWFHA
ncbi:MAG TPA: DUF819 family protein [Elusimicrobiota bacterium]|nr:DUF819 family protein [Elusimicrobiota bacterium]